MNVDEVFKDYIKPENAIPAKRKKLETSDTTEVIDDSLLDIDETKAKHLLIQLDKKLRINQEMRTKYSDQPLKFMDSEVDLFNSLNNFMIVTNNPEFYEMLMSNKMVPTILLLILHDNTDISLTAIKFILRLTESDDILNLGDVGERLINELMDGKLISHCVDVLAKLDENDSDEADGVFSILNVVENITEAFHWTKVEIANQQFLGWLLKRIQKRTFDENKLYVSEIIAILLLNCTENQEKLGELDGIDTLLRQLSVFKRNDPTSLNEFEMMENLFDALCYALFSRSNQERFLKGEGLQLMILMLRERKLSRNSAIKVLDFSTQGPIGNESAQANCNKFVDVLGLRVIFSYVMRTPDPKATTKSAVQNGSISAKILAKNGLTKSELEEHIINIMTNLICHTTGPQKARILTKFSENNCEKLERMVELHMTYLNKLSKTDTELDKKRENVELWRGMTHDEIEQELSYVRMSEGLLVLQNIDIIIADVFVNGDAVIRTRLLELFNLHKLSPRTIIRIIGDYKNTLEVHAGSTNPTKEWLELLLRRTKSENGETIETQTTFIHQNVLLDGVQIAIYTEQR